MNKYDKEKKVKSILKQTKKRLLKPKNKIKKVKYLQAQSYRMDKNKTWPEKEFESILIEMKIDYESQKILRGKIYDYFIPSANMLCEVDGDYYHGNPEKYEVLSEMQKKISQNDRYKNIIAKGMGFDIFRVWESELKENREYVKERIRNEILIKKL
jgi:very-short-patch-repair endonuclease